VVFSILSFRAQFLCFIRCSSTSGDTVFGIRENRCGNECAALLEMVMKYIYSGATGMYAACRIEIVERVVHTVESGIQRV